MDHPRARNPNHRRVGEAFGGDLGRDGGASFLRAGLGRDEGFGRDGSASRDGGASFLRVGLGRDRSASGDKLVDPDRSEVAPGLVESAIPGPPGSSWPRAGGRPRLGSTSSRLISPWLSGEDQPCPDLRRRSSSTSSEDLADAIGAVGRSMWKVSFSPAAEEWSIAAGCFGGAIVGSLPAVLFVFISFICLISNLKYVFSQN